MKRIGKQPRLLPSVMEAIANMRERYGSTQKQIIEHIAQTLRKTRDHSRNVTMQVRRALEHGLQSGLIKQRSGKYSLGLDKRDYAIFRRFRQITDPIADCNACKRRGRRGGRRRSRSRRRRGRRRTRYSHRRRPSTEDDMTENTESDISITSTPEPSDRSRRKRGKRRRGRRGRRRRYRARRSSTPDDANSDTSDAGRKESGNVMPPEKRRPEQDKPDYQPKQGSQDRNQEHAQDNDEDVDCGNPDCLCNIKQENDSPRSMSRENNYYNDSYMN